MAEIRYNDLLSQLSPMERQNFEGVLGNPGWLENYQNDPNALSVTGHESYNKFLPIATAASQSKTLDQGFFDNLFSMGSADAAMATPEERAAIERGSAEIEYNAPNYLGSRSPITYPYELDQGKTSGYSWNLGFPNVVAPGEAYDPAFGELSQYDKWDTDYPGSFEKKGWYNLSNRTPRLSQDDFYENFRDQAIADVPIKSPILAEEEITAKENLVDPGFNIDWLEKEYPKEEWELPDTDWGPQKRTRPQAGPNKFDRFLQGFGAPAMTQVTPADRLANKRYMGIRGIGRDPQTGRMTSGDFAGKNAPGTSGWGSANFGEMAQKWDEDYGDVEYSLGAMGDMKRKKQARMKQAAAQFAAQQQVQRQERIRNQRAAASAANQMTQRDPTGGGASGRHMGNISQAQASQVAAANAAAGMGGWRLAYGGRVGYNTGGRVGILSIF